MVIGLGLISASYPPCAWWAFFFLLTYIFGRLIFSIGYGRNGSDARLPGAIIMDLVLIALLGTAIVSFSKLI